jgi:choline dehydrogenase-like flavoprotein
MSHPMLLAWGLFPKPVGGFRGPLVTSGIESMRDGSFRKYRAAFRVDLANDGWGYAAGAPYSDVQSAVDQQNLFGEKLRQQLVSTLPRQVSFQFLVEQLPEPTNRITIDPAYVDQLGNYLPVLHYGISDYTRAGFAEARALSKRIFARLGIEDCTTYNPSDQGYFEYEGNGYGYWSAGHFAGAHRMGSSKTDSVVNPRQQTWDHENLYLVGAGNFCTIATPNPTLTLSALALLAADNILHDLR